MKGLPEQHSIQKILVSNRRNIECLENLRILNRVVYNITEHARKVFNILYAVQ